jgi:hypothetical protein
MKHRHLSAIDLSHRAARPLNGRTARLQPQRPVELILSPVRGLCLIVLLIRWLIRARRPHANPF